MAELSFKQEFIKIFFDREIDFSKVIQRLDSINSLAINLHIVDLSDIIKGHTETAYADRIIDLLMPAPISSTDALILYHTKKAKLYQKFDFIFFYYKNFRMKGPITQTMYALIPDKFKKDTILAKSFPKEWNVREPDNYYQKTVADLKKRIKPPFIYVKRGSYYHAYKCNPAYIDNFINYLHSLNIKARIVK